MTAPITPPFYFALALIGLEADKPAATAVPTMTLYWATDTPAFYLSDGTSWNVPPGGGGGGIAAWGQVSTAQYAGSGSPVGVVTPDAEGDVYIDTTGPGLWQATGTGSSDWTQLGTGSGGDWGQASTAHFSGAGFPGGVVTPSGEGDLYVDFSTPALWQANGTGSSDWQEIGTGSSQPLALLASSFDAGPNWGSGIAEWFDIGSSADGANARLAGATTSPPVLIDPASVVADVQQPSTIARIPVDADSFGAALTLWVTDLAGTNVLQVQVAASTTPGDTSLSIDWTTATATPIAGTDLAWDGTSQVTSTAGGIFVAALSYAAGWS